MKTFKIFFLATSLLFIYCKGQLPNDQNENKTSTLGAIVSKMDEKIWKVYQDKNDNYWFGSNGNGVYYFNGKQLRNYTTKDGLIDNAIRGFQEDTLGNIFIETHSGISKFNGSKFITLIPEISEENKWKLTATDLWFHTNKTEIDVYRYDGESLIGLQLPRKDLDKAFETKVVGLGFKDMSTSPYSIFGIDKDKDGNMWFGTIVAGAFRYDGTSFLWFLEKELSTLTDGRVPGVRSIIQDKNGHFWLSNFISKYKVSEDGSSYEKFEGISKSITFFDNRIPYFNAGLVDNFGNLWMTTYTGGVWKYDGKTLSNYPVFHEDEDVLLISIYSDNDNMLWLGTDNAGVFKFNGETFDRFEPINN
ncbi:hypothetical protein ULMS_09270 [Patiriisocius marinistellae]|uniref:Uncharacterized protein n=1 Tax=Patiriisocius marinistellae TaxID=2494560 RepID=A0A5J4FZ33_9FLAO|nr:two-component regulator propeller domain-containing protein [Patiriisocius marinistellae]GEQ85419.1 hypothetical protein ULMS_09270 [Patiriisocius marinistellae]